MSLGILLWLALAAAIFIVFVVKAMVEGQEKRLKRNLRSTAKVDPSSGEFIVRQPALANWALAILFLVGIVFVASVVEELFFSDDPAISELTQRTVFAVLWGLITYGAVRSWVRFYVSDTGIRMAVQFSRPKSISWTEIDAVSVSTFPRAFVLSAGKTKMLIPLSYEGLNSLSSHIVKHVPWDRRKRAFTLLAESLGHELLPGGITT